MRMTKQKKVLYKEVEKYSSFFDAYELHDGINQKIGLATVYRFLNTLEKDGKLHSFMCNNKKIYSTNKRSHAHFTCEVCSKVKHINITNVDFLHQSVKEEVRCFQIELSGVCKDCRRAKQDRI